MLGKVRTGKSVPLNAGSDGEIVIGSAEIGMRCEEIDDPFSWSI